MRVIERALAVQAALALDGQRESLECVHYVVEAMLGRGMIGVGRMPENHEVFDMAFVILNRRLMEPIEATHGLISVAAEAHDRINGIAAAVLALRETAT